MGDFADDVRRRADLEREEVNEPGGLLDILDQDDVWRTADGHVIAIDGMTDRHKNNVLGYLHRHADQIKFAAELAEVAFHASPLGVTADAAVDAHDDAMLALAEQAAVDWLLDQPLVKRLRADLGLT